jgi:hypothetical protein
MEFNENIKWIIDVSNKHNFSNKTIEVATYIFYLSKKNTSYKYNILKIISLFIACKYDNSTHISLKDLLNIDLSKKLYTLFFNIERKIICADWFHIPLKLCFDYLDEYCLVKNNLWQEYVDKVLTILQYENYMDIDTESIIIFIFKKNLMLK